MLPSPPSAPAADTRGRRAAIVIAALAVSLIVFAVYHATLLPGVDFGDSGSMQATTGSPLITPRDGYPLYFAIAGLVLHAGGGNPAHAANVTSAIEGAIASGVFVLVAAELAGALAPAIAAALLFAFSYTFWSQCVTAEVYALHMTFLLASLFLLLRWERRPTTGRLALFFASYALGFGNHLSMVLLLPGFTVFLLIGEPHGWRTMVTPRIIMLATVIAGAGALQYAWNLHGLWLLPQPPATVWDAARIFWFDVTKSDWRDTMVLNVPRAMITDHASMYGFDLTQQFGFVGPMLAVAGAVSLFLTHCRRAWLIALLYVVNLAFAFSYNVGDAHVFYLPSHIIVALLTAVGIVSLARLVSSRTAMATACAALLAAYAGVRGYRDYPVLDRSGDDRAERVLASLTDGIDDRRAVLLSDLNWQIANGLSYFDRAAKPEAAVARTRDVLLYAPVLARDNTSAGRSVFATEESVRLLRDAFDPLIEVRNDIARLSLHAELGTVPTGTRYALAVLKPTLDFPMDRNEVRQTLTQLTNEPAIDIPSGDYAIVAGIAGQRPALIVGSDVPFSQHVDVGGVPVDVRMESWLAADTIRRMGFGHVIAARHHTLIIERGVSLATFDEHGAPQTTIYRANIFEPQARYLIRPRGEF